jgi:hypothetical protein
MTQKRFSATQYALFSSLFGLPRILSGPIAGFAAYPVGRAGMPVRFTRGVRHSRSYRQRALPAP